MSARSRARGLFDSVSSQLRKAGERYAEFAENAARPLMREYDARLMTPDERAGLVFSQRQGSRLDSSDSNLLGRLMISDPADEAANRLLSDRKFAAAVGSTPDALMKQRQQTLDAIELADRLQAEEAPNQIRMHATPSVPALDDSLRVSTLLKAARADGSNESVNRLFEAVANPQVSRPSDPQEWDIQAISRSPMNEDFNERMMHGSSYLNPVTGQKVQRKPLPVPPGNINSQVESLSDFLNRAYPTPEAAVSLGELESKALQTKGGFNRDFAATTPTNSDSIGSQAFRDLETLRNAVAGVEDLGLTAAERLGHTPTAERLRKAEGLKGRSKIHGSDGQLQEIALDRLAARQQEMGRQLTKEERTKLLNELNDELPDVAYRLGLGALEQEEARTLKPRRFAADVLAAADRAGFAAVNVPDVASAGLRQPKYSYVSDDARDLNQLIVNPTTGAVIGGTALLGTAAAITAAINNQRKDDLKFNRDITGHEAFSKTIPEEVQYVLRNIDPEVLAQIMNQ